MLDPELLTGLEEAVEAAPDNRPLHFHLIALLLNGGLADRATGRPWAQDTIVTVYS